ncbi:hypothetical protein FALBO_8877 [Fusarium albosuccineum]|uniref:Uncharacterized protein n=1 Tax=Fusarium albosuccineum TaxID=1237068 RepID=A0A8H4L9Y9_9HYPO|nr:hypothetical protein FALBO_8877 [Fusarium albosuccineum]
MADTAGVSANPDAGAEGERALTGLEIATITTTIAFFVLGICAIFLCRSDVPSRRQHSDGPLRHAEEGNAKRNEQGPLQYHTRLPNVQDQQRLSESGQKNWYECKLFAKLTDAVKGNKQAGHQTPSDNGGSRGNAVIDMVSIQAASNSASRGGNRG